MKVHDSCDGAESPAQEQSGRLLQQVSVPQDLLLDHHVFYLEPADGGSNRRPPGGFSLI